VTIIRLRTFAVHRLLIFPLNVITAKRHYRYHGIAASCLRYYREIFPVPAVITVVTEVLPLSPLPCHPLGGGNCYRRIDVAVTPWIG